ncbi:Metabotropic glutamate receptor 5 [Trichinella britovi]|uniref:Metabotropic glutamate receptor 5 n=1 Tax=Trichinella britovi TaxID=45882 RepID=A0A0V1D2N9_TRIBR|nr:Metabotropic glutamate receptor 5 [Trichinella britovi]
MLMVVVSIWLAVSLTAVLAPKSASHTRVARIPGDVEIGALFPIHRKIAGTERCGEIWEQYGIQRTEIALKTVDAINDDNALLANLKLGISVRDDCWTERIAMEQTIIMVRDAVGGPNAHSKQQRCCCCPEDKHCQANDGDEPTSNLVAVIGPGSSDVSIAVQNLLQVFHIPQVGYSATTKALSDKTEFKYYMRMVPSDSWQAKAIVDIVKYFHWSYVAVVYTDGSIEISRIIDAGCDFIISCMLVCALQMIEARRRLCDSSTSKPHVLCCCCCCCCRLAWSAKLMSVANGSISSLAACSLQLTHLAQLATLHAFHFRSNRCLSIQSNARNYGEKGFEELQKNFDKEDNLCIGVAEKIKSLAPAADYDALIRLLMTHRPQITVAICFCEGDTIKRIFQATKRVRESLQPDGNDTYQGLQWIGSESWSDRKDVVAGVEDVAAGGFSFRIYSPRMTQFDSYYFNLTPKNNFRNPWFVDFWEEKFHCSYTESTRNLYPKICTGNENVSYGYKPDPKLSQVTNAIYTVAYALDAMYNDLCKGSKEKGLCDAMTPVDGTVLFQYMLKTMFRDPSGQEIYFDANGDPPARYDILNYQGKVASYVTAGEWDHSFHSDKFNHQSGIYYKSKLRIDRDKILWHNHMSGLTYTPTARCSYDCKVGEIKKIQTLKCCWICVPCYENEYLLNEYACKRCPLGYWPLENRTACYKLEVEYMRWSDAEAVVCVVFACVGIIATLFTIVIFILHNSTPVVKATTRELSYIILVGLLLCYMTTFFIISPPNMVSCIIRRIVPGTAFSMIYGALFTKTNRIARILAASKKITTKRRRFLSISAQVTITGLLVLVELITIVVFLIFEPPKADFDYSLPKRVLLVCRTSGLTFFAPFGFDLFLVGMCTLYAVKTRNLPENFNEAKFIGFTMYTTCVIWLAFIAIYFGSAKKDTTMCICFSLSATVALILLYFPKMYVILLRPEKNARSYFKTTTTIRCHFGSNAKSSSSDGGGGGGGGSSGSRISSVQGSQRKKRFFKLAPCTTYTTTLLSVYSTAASAAYLPANFGTDGFLHMCTKFYFLLPMPTMMKSLFFDAFFVFNAEPTFRRYVARNDSHSSYSAQSTPDPAARGRRHSGRFAAGDELTSRDEQQADESACKPDECSSDSQRLLRAVDEMPSVKEETDDDGGDDDDDDDEPTTSSEHPVSSRKFLDRTGSLWRRFDPFQQNPQLNRGWRSLRVPAGRNDGEAAPTLLLKIAAERLDTVRHFIDVDPPASGSTGTTAAVAERQPRSNVSTISGRASFARRKGTGHVWFSSSVGETDDDEEEEDGDDDHNKMDTDRRGTTEKTLLHSHKDRLVVCRNSQPESGEKQTAFSNGGFPVIEFDEVDMRRTVVLGRSTNKTTAGEDPLPHRRPWGRKVRSNSDTVAWLLQRQSQLSNFTWNLTRSESEQLLGPVRGNSLKTLFTRKPFAKQQTKSMPCLRFDATVDTAGTAKQQYSSPGSSSLVTTALTGFSRAGSMSGSLLLSPIEELSNSSGSGSAKSSNGSSPTSVTVSGYDFSTISLV